MTNKGDFSTTPGAVVCQNTVNLPPQYCHHFCPCATYCEPGCALDCTTKPGGEAYVTAQHEFVDGITMAVANAVAAGIRPEDIRAGLLRLVLGIQAY